VSQKFRRLRKSQNILMNLDKTHEVLNRCQDTAEIPRNLDGAHKNATVIKFFVLSLFEALHVRNRIRIESNEKVFIRFVFLKLKSARKKTELIKTRSSHIFNHSQVSTNKIQIICYLKTRKRNTNYHLPIVFSQSHLSVSWLRSH
jgi:hypothetical protein